MPYIPTIIFVALLAIFYSLTNKLHFNIRVILSLVVGIVFGLLLQRYASASTMVLTGQAFKLVGDGYLALLKMLVVPLILTSIVFAIVNLGQLSGVTLRKLSIRSVAMLLGMTAIASAIGMGVGLWFHVGAGLQLPEQLIMPTHPYTDFVDTLLAMLPSNPVKIMVDENTVAIVLFAVLLGVAALMVIRVDAEKGEAFKAFMSSAFQVMKKLASIVIALTPYGVLALMANVGMMQGLSALRGEASFIAAMYVAMALVIVMHLLILMAGGNNPWAYLKRAYAPLVVAFTTRSSLGTLPVTEETLRKKFNTKQVTASFVPGIGATLGMNACAGVFPAMLVVMALTILHQPMTLSMFFMVMFINAIASLGISGIPGTAFVAATVTLTTLHLPYAVVGLVQGFDPIIDMGRTATNVNGVMTTAITVDKQLD
tara:strand:+ start:36906 stop:38186 length:1281 start_codon:yes stop_codon:yes gene_type:complete